MRRVQKGQPLTLKGFFCSSCYISQCIRVREVFTNIINNALDAMPEGGNICVKTFKKKNHIFIKISRYREWYP